MKDITPCIFPTSFKLVQHSTANLLGFRGACRVEKPAHLGGDLNTLAVVRAGRAVHETWDGVELAADLLNHGQGSLAHRLHGHGAEPVWEHCADKEPGKDLLSIISVSLDAWMNWGLL